MIALIYAHPHPTRSRANRVLLDAVCELPSVTVHSLYDRYPDFDIDVAAERRLLLESQLIVWQHPIMWYSAPALQKLWFDTVLANGWATGDGGTALVGKSCLWVTTTGGPSDTYTPQGAHRFPFSAFTPAIEMTARYCGMHWLPPLVVHGAHEIDKLALHQCAAEYRQRLLNFVAAGEDG
ncbi:NAD(P)H-dependent oxidoreductase [Accumulibacter sp.]|uniref:glutathione-regulated potassium-efflux system oxidoreductase KefF n=1 Tax=Accumulibacter sp. TaxID=2053492 RepID=UPI0026242123|nr:NAD(P)H-dependent oxidoreductase [Accumulibacter sp.]